MGGRRRWRFRGGRQCGRGAGRRLREVRGRVSRARTGPVWTFRPGARRQVRLGRGCVYLAVRPLRARAMGRAADAPLHESVRNQPGAARGGRARDLKQKPAYLMAAAQGSGYRHVATAENAYDYSTSNFKTLAPRLFETAGITPKDVDCAQVYEHFSGAVMISLAEHGFCKPEEIMEFVTFENITAPKGKLPINTSGGNIAECYMHGLELVNEAVRQVRGESTCQVPDCKIALVASGPMVSPVSDLIVHSN